MSAVNETIVREFFEGRGFLVHQLRKFVAPGLATEPEIDFLVVNPRRRDPGPELPAVLEPEDVGGLLNAAVAVKGWHTETFSVALLAQEPEITRFTDPDRLAKTARAFGLEPPLTRVLVVPALPQGKSARDDAVSALRAKGVDAVLPFRALLADLVRQVEVNRNYAKSDFLQSLRILKKYDLLKDPELELFRTRRRGRRDSPDQGLV